MPTPVTDNLDDGWDAAPVPPPAPSRDIDSSWDDPPPVVAKPAPVVAPVAPKIEAPPQVEAKPVPKVEAPKVEAPKVEAKPVATASRAEPKPVEVKPLAPTPTVKLEAKPATTVEVKGEPKPAVVAKPVPVVATPLVAKPAPVVAKPAPKPSKPKKEKKQKKNPEDRILRAKRRDAEKRERLDARRAAARNTNTAHNQAKPRDPKPAEPRVKKAAKAEPVTVETTPVPTVETKVEATKAVTLPTAPADRTPRYVALGLGVLLAAAVAWWKLHLATAPAGARRAYLPAMAKITGLGGLFFKTDNPAATAAWFTEKLGLPTQSWGRKFPWRDFENPEKTGATVLGLHGQSSDSFGPSKQPFMLSFRVDDLDGVLADLEQRGVTILKRLPADEYGQFAHVAGPDDITIELWQPPPPKAGS